LASGGRPLRPNPRFRGGSSAPGWGSLRSQRSPCSGGGASPPGDDGDRSGSAARSPGRDHPKEAAMLRRLLPLALVALVVVPAALADGSPAPPAADGVLAPGGKARYLAVNDRGRTMVEQ